MREDGEDEMREGEEKKILSAFPCETRAGALRRKRKKSVLRGK